MTTLCPWVPLALVTLLLGFANSFMLHNQMAPRVRKSANSWPLRQPKPELLNNLNIISCFRIEDAKTPPTKHRLSLSDENDPMNEDRNVGILVLLTVPFAWGTFEPAVRYVYEIKPAVPGFVFSVGYYLVAALALSLLSLLTAGSDKTVNENEQILAQNIDMRLPMKGGIELGTYLFVGNALQVVGLQTVPSDRAAFLLQLTTIFVPLVQAAINRDVAFISLKTWVACTVALMGVAVISLDGQDMSTLQSPLSVSSLINLSQGDWLIVAAAFSYTFHCIRLERYAKETSAIKLGAAKATTEMALCLSLVICLLVIADTSSGVVDGPLGYVVNAGQEIANYFTSITQAWSEGSIPRESLYPAIVAVLWTGLVTVAYTITAQSFGQAKVDPITANLIYTIQPLCTAIFAFGLLGETLGPTGYFGGALIAYAVYLVAVE